MAILEMQGFDNQSIGVSSSIFGLLKAELRGGSVEFLAGEGLYGGTALRAVTAQYLTCTVNIPSGYGGGVWVYYDSLPWTSREIFANYPARTDTNISFRQLALSVTSDGSVILTAASGGGLVVEGAGTIVPGFWYYFALSSSWGNSATVVTRVNNSVKTFTGVDTSWGSINNNYLRVVLSTQFKVDDVVFTNDRFYAEKPPRVIDYLVSTADRPQQDFTPINGGSGYEEINEYVPDGNASYVYSNTLGHVSEFELGDLAVGVGSVAAVQLVSTASKDGAGVTLGVKSSLHTSASDTEIVSLTPALNPSTYVTAISPIVEINPDTGVAFTPAEIDTMYLSLEVV